MSVGLLSITPCSDRACSVMITSIIRWSEYFNNRFINGDQSWYDNPLEIWLIVEPSIYLISACLLSYRQLFRSIAQSHLVSSIYSILNRSKSYASFDNHQAKTHKNPFDRYRSKNMDLEHSAILPHPSGSTTSGKISAEPGNAMELAALPVGRIHVNREFNVVS